MVKAARNLRLIILAPAQVLSWAFGIFLFAAYLAPDWQDLPRAAFAAVPHWFWLKLALVLGLSGYHGLLLSEGRKLAAGERNRSERFWRVMPAVPFLIAIAVVPLATVEP